MVSTKLYGRLGNQLFQISAMIGYAIKNKMSYMLPEKTLDEKVWPNYFKYARYLNKYDDRFRHIGLNVYKEPAHSYSEIPQFNFVTLDGYFQSYKYFDFCVDYLRYAFQFPNAIKKQGFISIHVRRGDYLLYPDKHPVVTEDYLFKAIEYFDSEPMSFLIFSNDNEWCANLFSPGFIRNFKNEHSFSLFPSGRDPLATMHNMSIANHHIISNSSFSWWPAFLNQSPDKVVITPDESNWFGPANKHLDVSDLLPLSWERIKF